MTTEAEIPQAAVQQPLDELGEPTIYDAETDTWGHLDDATSAERLEERQRRLQRAMAAGTINAIDLLKLRLDVVTQFAVGGPSMQMLDSVYEHTLDQMLAHVEKNSGLVVATAMPTQQVAA